MMLEKTLENPLDSKEIKPENPRGNQSWIFIGSTDAEAEAPILWPPDGKSRLMEMTLMLGKIEGRRGRVQQRRNGWMASPTQWTWIWAKSRRWWRTGKPGVQAVWQLSDWTTITKLIWPPNSPTSRKWTLSRLFPFISAWAYLSFYFTSIWA